MEYISRTGNQQSENEKELDPDQDSSLAFE
ncbi:hypothetical protein SAMN05216316_2469, partial [Nitrosovibrio sp. Nv6]